MEQKQARRLWWAAGALIVVAAIVLVATVGNPKKNEMAETPEPEVSTETDNGSLQEDEPERPVVEEVAEVEETTDLPTSGPEGVIGLAAILGVTGYLWALNIRIRREKQVYLR